MTLRVGARNSVVAGQAASLYSLIRPLQRVDLTPRGGAGSLLAVTCESFELALVPDDGAVEQFAAQGPNPAFGECVRDR